MRTDVSDHEQVDVGLCNLCELTSLCIVTLTYLKDQDESSAGEAEHKHNIQQHEVQRAGPRSATSGTD
jgi:hypothetical protein